MHHFFEAITNTSGQSLIGYFARVVNPTTQALVTIYADNAGTPISTVSGLANAGKTDDFGNLSFYVDPGTYHLDIYGPDGTTFRYRVSNVAMNSTKGDKGDTGDTGDTGPANNTYNSYWALLASDRTRQYAYLVGDTDVPAQPDGVFSNPTKVAGAWVRQGAESVRFQPAGTGAVARTMQDKAREIVSAADYGASASATAAQNVAAIQAALNTGNDVFLPDLYVTNAPVLSVVAGQRLFGRGYGTGIICTGSDNNANAIAITHDRFIVENMRVEPGTTLSSLFHGWCVAINANYCVVKNCYFRKMRRGGVILNSSQNCIVTGNVCTESVVKNDGTETQAQMGYDIYLYGTSSYNIVSANQCISGSGAGIGLQNVEIGKSLYGNVVDGNVVRFQPCYGIMLYLSASGMGMPSDRVDNNVISNNIVTDISGSVLITDPAGTLFYGAGIYIQGSDGFACNSNQVLRTNTDTSKPRSGSDVPAAIGISGFCRGTVTGNNIDTCHFGVAVITSSFALPDGDGTVVANNTIRNARNHGIYLASANSATVSANRVIAASGNTNKGIFVVQGATYPMGPFQIIGNLVSGFATGIESNTVTGSTVGSILVQANKVRNFMTYGIFAKADEADIQNNSVASAAGSGIVIASTVTRGLVDGNVVITPAGNALEDAGPNTTVGDNDFAAGALVGYPAALANAATPSLKGRRYVKNSNTTTITGFTGGQEGQRVVLTAEASFTLQNGTNLILNGGVDRAMTAGQAIQLVYAAPRWRQI